MSRLSILLLLSLQLFRLTAQDTLVVRWVEMTTDGKVQFDSSFVTHPLKPLDLLIDEFTFSLRDSGYYSIGLDSMVGSQQHTTIFLSKGSLYTTITGWETSQDASQRQINPKSFAKIAFDTVKVLGESGYPLAKAHFKVIDFHSDTIVMALIIEKGPILRFGGFEQTGVIKPNPKYLQAITHIHMGDLYSDSAFRAIPHEIRKSQVYQVNRETALRFHESFDSTYTIVLDIKQRQKSSLWGMAGLTPAQADGSLKLTGEAQADIVGLMNHGDIFHFRWTSPGKGSQELRTRLSYPYLFGTRFGFEAGFQLKKIDTLFLNREFGGVVFFQTNPENRSGITIKQWASSELSGLERQSTKRMAGLTYQMENLDLRFNPSKGIGIDLTLESGILKTSTAEDDNDSTWNRISLQGSINYYHPLSRLLILHGGADGAVLLGNSLVEQEKYRIGGASVLRGFDEESQIVSSYLCATLSLRIRPDDDTYFGAFWDAAYLVKDDMHGFFHGFGIEAGIGIPVGMIIIQYALGKQPETPINLNAGRVHVGMRGRF